MKLKPDDYILSYYMASDKDNNNWYMMVWKSDGKWRSEYTFRYCKDDNSDPWNGKDVKNVYPVSYNGDIGEDEILAKMAVIFEVIKIKYNDFHDLFLVQGDFMKFKKIAETKHYLHIKENKTDGISETN